MGRKSIMSLSFVSHQLIQELGQGLVEISVTVERFGSRTVSALEGASGDGISLFNGSLSHAAMNFLHGFFEGTKCPVTKVLIRARICHRGTYRRHAFQFSRSLLDLSKALLWQTV